MKTKKLTPEELELLEKCDGKHANIDDLFSCPSCEVLLKD